MKSLLITFLVLHLSVMAFGQSMIQTSGKVVDGETNEPIIGCNVLVQNADKGTITDVDGSYSLSVPSNAVLVFSYLGYKTIEIPVNGSSTIDVTLSPNSELLDEIVVVDFGYGAVKKSDLTGSVASIGAK